MDVNRIKVSETKSKVTVNGSDFQLSFDPQKGTWNGFKVNDIEFFAQGLTPNFWRVPIDNDGSALLNNLSIPGIVKKILLPQTRWKDAGSSRKLIHFMVEKQDSGKQVSVLTSYKISGGKNPLILNYEILSNGIVSVEYQFTPRVKMLRAGLQVSIPGNYRHITWFGRGPQESMLDRKSGYAVGIYELDIEDFIHSYVRPQENANRSDVRWVKFLDDSGHGVEIQSGGDHLLNFSAWPYTMDDLEKATHIHELPRRENITLNIDYDQKGVGDLTSQFLGLPEDAQLLTGKLISFRFKIMVI